MILTDLITSFYNKTGRLDLSDAEVTDVLNQASELLDQLETSDDSYSRYYRILEAGEYIVTLPDKVRWLQRIGTLVGTVRTQLTREDSFVIRSYIESSISPFDVSAGPLIYSKINTRLGDNPTSDLLGFHLDMDAVILDPATLKTAILIYPPCVEQTIIDIEGIFYSPSLSADNPTNKWSELYPHYIIQAAQYILMKDMLNMDESAKMLSVLQETVKPITHDAYSDEAINQMGG